MINAAATHTILQQALQPVSLTPGTTHTHESNASVSIQSCALLTSLNGALLLHAGTPLGTAQGPAGTSPSAALNNLRMMALLCKDKWENEEGEEQELEQERSYAHGDTRIYNYELEGLHAAVARIPASQLLLVCIAPPTFPYGLLTLRLGAVLDACGGLRGYTLGQ